MNNNSNTTSGLFVARFIDEAKRPTKPDNTIELTQDIEFAWMDQYTEFKGKLPSETEMHNFVQLALVESFVVFGISCLITDTKGSATYHITALDGVLQGQHLHQALAARLQKTCKIGLWQMRARHPRALIKPIVQSVLEKSELYTALNKAQLNPQIHMTELDYHVHEGAMVISSQVVFMVNEIDPNNRFAAFARIAKQFDLQKRPAVALPLCN